MAQEIDHTLLSRIAEALERLAPAQARRSPTFRAFPPSSGMPARRSWSRCRRVNRVEIVAAQGHRPDARHPDREHRALRQGPSRQQRAAVGRARHGQVLPRQGGAPPDQRGHRRQPQARRDPPRGHREPAAAHDHHPQGAGLPLHRVLRRSLLRCRRHLLQVAEGRARRRHRGPARQHGVLRHLEPPPPAAARHDRERALDRHQPLRGGAGEGLALGPLRPVARLPQLLAGRVPRHGRGLCPALRPEGSARRNCAPAPSPGRRRAAAARAAWPGSISRTWRAGIGQRLEG